MFLTPSLKLCRAFCNLRTIGNMHEIPPVGDPVTLAPPVDAFLDVPPQGDGFDLEAPVAMIDTEAGQAPPRVAFRETVRLTR